MRQGQITYLEVIRESSTRGELVSRNLLIRRRRRIPRRLYELRGADSQRVRARSIVRRIEDILVWAAAPRRRGVSSERPHARIARRDHDGDALQTELHDLVASSLDV